jgi:MarR family transcriptional regulator for hemolysin
MASDTHYFGYEVADVTRLIRRVFDRRSARLGLTRAQWRVLNRLERAQGSTQAELADVLDLEPIAVGRVVDRLESAGFIERRADPVDRRCWRLFLAPKSAGVMAEMRQLADALRAEMLAGVDEQEYRTMMAVLGKIRETLDQLDRAGRKPVSP